MKVKVFTDGFIPDIENQINKFLEQNKVKIFDIKYATYPIYDDEGKACDTAYTALVIYE